MNKLFGAGKKKEVKKADVPDPNAPSLGETSTKLGERTDVLQKKVNDLNVELMQVKKEMMNSTGMRRK